MAKKRAIPLIFTTTLALVLLVCNRPNEMQNLYMEPEKADLIASLKEQLEHLQIQYGDNISLEEMREETLIKISPLVGGYNLNTLSEGS
jgi:hypothetical protein